MCDPDHHRMLEAYNSDMCEKQDIDYETHVENIWTAAKAAAEQASSPYNTNCPYPDGSDDADIWNTAYRYYLYDNGWH